MKVLKLLRIALLLFLLVAALAFLLLPSAVVWYSNTKLKQTEVRVEKIKSIHPAKTFLQLSGLVLAVPVAEYHAQLSIDELRLPYDLLLQRTGESEIEINRATLRIEVNQQSISLQPELKLFLQNSPDRILIRGSINIADQFSELNNLSLNESGNPGVSIDLKLLECDFTFSVIGGDLQKETAIISLVSRASSLKYEELQAEDLKAEATFNLFSQKTTKPLILQAGRLTSALELKNISAKSDLDLSNKNFLATNLKASGSLLGGSLSLSSARLALGKKIAGSMLLEIRNLSLEKLMEVYPSDNVEATGSVDLKLPLSVKKEGWHIQEGSIKTNGKGRLSVRLSDYEAGSQMAILSKALSNFQYEKIEGSVSLIPSGELSMFLKLSGINPDLNKDQPINVNARVEQNLWALLKSIRLTRRLTSNL